jgi:hypothetical protein
MTGANTYTGGAIVSSGTLNPGSQSNTPASTLPTTSGPIAKTGTGTLTLTSPNIQFFDGMVNSGASMITLQK